MSQFILTTKNIWQIGFLLFVAMLTVGQIETIQIFRNVEFINLDDYLVTKGILCFMLFAGSSHMNLIKFEKHARAISLLAIVAPTDPIAATSILKKFNDIAGKIPIVFFTIFVLLIILVKIEILYWGWQSGQLDIGGIAALLVLVDNAYTPIAIFNVLFE